MSDAKNRHYLRNDIILITSVIVLCIVAIFFFNATKKEGGRAVVVINGKETASYPLNINTEVRLENNGGYNILVIEDGFAFIKEASCPDKICVNNTKKKYNGETLVCLPNKITVKIVSDETSETDF
ncbi:MAG: NusG domain II-containing protein [Clostridia bacterium]|nr:NusG domain II-containing protein [Clostridia bacterium]